MYKGSKKKRVRLFGESLTLSGSPTGKSECVNYGNPAIWITLVQTEVSQTDQVALLVIRHLNARPRPHTPYSVSHGLSRGLEEWGFHWVAAGQGCADTVAPTQSGNSGYATAYLYAFAGYTEGDLRIRSHGDDHQRTRLDSLGAFQIS